MVLLSHRLAQIEMRHGEPTNLRDERLFSEHPLADPIAELLPERWVGELDPVGLKGQRVDPAAEVPVVCEMKPEVRLNAAGEQPET